ncbi:hypothetical protein OG558_28920 [Kribbella sp. NBC_01510]|uniref:alcohol dehydrogenase catalytic domain-containing protein n=1 Tax=Kribbella sp. NBC_01510 TaxID=2903581 RepID=UPI0038701D9B
MTMNDQQDAVRTTMPALLQRSQRGPEDLLLRTDQGVPTPGTGEYLIRVGAAGVNFADVMQTYGTYAGGPQAPYVAGFEAAGEIVASDLMSKVRSRLVLTSSESALGPSPRTW